MSDDKVVILYPCIDILETLVVSLLNFSFLNFIYFGCCVLVLLSDKLAGEIDPVFLVVLLCLLFQFFGKRLVYTMNLIHPMIYLCFINFL